MAKKIVLITSSPDDATVKNAIKALEAGGEFEVQVEEPDATSVLHIAIGLLSPTRYGFTGGDASKNGDERKDDKAEEGEELEQEEKGEGADVAPPGSDFSFESLGFVTIDGEKVEAFLNPTAKVSVLEATQLNSASNRVDYHLNESKFAFYVQPDGSGLTSPVAEHRIAVNNQSASATLAVLSLAESKTDKPRLIVGSDYKRLFA